MIGWIFCALCALYAATWLAIAIRVRKLTQARMARAMELATELALLKSGHDLEGKI